jgi:hypothetical protein
MNDLVAPKGYIPTEKDPSFRGEVMVKALGIAGNPFDIFPTQRTGGSAPTMESESVANMSRSYLEISRQMDALAAGSEHLISDHCEAFQLDGRDYFLPKYIFRGPVGGADPITIAIFAGIHGDEPDGAEALVRFAAELLKNPEAYRGYELYLYPICNPTGFDDRTRHSRRGLDLNREFWRDSTEPEVEILQRELRAHVFQGIIAINSEYTSV